MYTKEDGTKVYKQPDGTFTTNINGTGTVVPANQVIASMNSAGNSSTDPTKLQNVGSSIADKTGTTFLDKINTAAADPNAKYGAVNVTDLKSTSDALIDKGLVFDANNGEPKTNKLGSKVTIAGTGALGTTENFTDKYNTDNIRTNIKQDASGNTTVEIGLNKNLKGLESVSVQVKMALMVKTVYPLLVKMVRMVLTVKFLSVKTAKMLYLSPVKTVSVTLV